MYIPNGSKKLTNAVNGPPNIDKNVVKLGIVAAIAKARSMNVERTAHRFQLNSKNKQTNNSTW